MARRSDYYGWDIPEDFEVVPAKYTAGGLAVDSLRNAFAFAARLAWSPFSGFVEGAGAVIPEPKNVFGLAVVGVGLAVLWPIPVAIGVATAAVKPFWVAGEGIARVFDTVGKMTWGETPWLTERLDNLNDTRNVKYVGPEYHERRAEERSYDLVS